jgi:3-hydroxymyristoyl/3-hydroxydecanoyl-(acyl carrier protein) dehydratase
MQRDHADILRTLPHRPPFLFIDRVIDLSPGARGTGLKRVTADELLLAGQGMALPTILHLEIMAQTTAMICAGGAPAEADQPGPQPGQGMGYLAGADLEVIEARAAQPGDTLEARVEIIKFWSPFIMARGSIFIDGHELSRGRFTIALADAEASRRP